MKKLAVFVVLGLASTVAFADITGWANQTDRDWVYVQSPVGSGGTWAGMFTFTITSGNLPDGSGAFDQFQAFCIDLSEYVSQSCPYEIVDLSQVPTPEIDPWQPMGADRANLVRELYARSYNELFDGDHDTRDRQAFQLAIWEIIYELDDQDQPGFGDVRSGEFWAFGLSSGVANVANGWLGELTGFGPYANLIGLESQDQFPNAGQDFVTLISVPVPGAVLLGLLGLGLVWRNGRRTS